MSELIVAIPKTHCPKLDIDIQRWAESYRMPTVITDTALQEHIARWGLPWFRAGAVVANRAGKILMVHEGRVQVKKIKDEATRQRFLSEGYKPNAWVDGDGGWNLPAGRLTLDEYFEDGAGREVNEESGWKVTIKQHLCTRSSEKPGNQYIMPVFLADPVSGPDQYHTDETIEIGWFTVEEVRSLGVAGLLRSPESVIESLDAYQSIIG